VNRDPRLRALSSEHHRALVLARRSARAAVSETEGAAAAAWKQVEAAFAAELAAHFEVEERVLLPALRDAGEVDLVEKTLADHAAIRACIADRGDVRLRLERFAGLLGEHVRFEERTLFEVAQARLAPEVLEELAAAHR
jgi:hemerythrin-like domain-containing protein